MWWRKKKALPSPNAECAVYRKGNDYIVRRLHTGEGLVVVIFTICGRVVTRDVYAKPAFHLDREWWGFSDQDEPSRFSSEREARKVALHAEAYVSRIEKAVSNAFAIEERVWR